MTAEVFVPRGYVSKTFWPTASPIKSDDKHRNVTMVDIVSHLKEVDEIVTVLSYSIFAHSTATV